MKRFLSRAIPAALIAAVVAATAVIGAFYFKFIQRKIYEDSTVHLKEIYGQVNGAFGSFVQRNWGILEDFGDHILSLSSPDGLDGFIAEKKKYWGFSEFYFLSDGMCMTSGGEKRNIDLGAAWEELSEMGEPVMASVNLDGHDMTVFAVPAAESEFDGFDYSALAISYSNSDLASSLNVDAFSGKAKCFVIGDDGSVLLSTQTGGNIFENYLVYLRGASDLDEDELSTLARDWQTGAEGLLNCSIGGVSYCILYQPVGYRDYVLLSSVPQSAVSAGFSSVQRITVNVLIAIFSIIGVTVATLLIIRGRTLSRRTRTELMYRERMFDVLSNSVDDIFIMIDAENFSVDYISPNIERLLGIPLQAAKKDIRVVEKCAVGRTIIVPKNELEEIPLNGSRYSECEYMHQTTGERRWYRMTIYHMSIQNMRKYISVMSDRTQEQQMNLKLTEALNAARSANEAKSNFLSNMSHDIRTPMNAIVGFSVLLEKDADRPEKVREYTKKITASSQHLLSLINDVLDMSKIESGKTSLNVDSFSLPELLEELNIIIMPQAKAKNQTFKIFLQSNPPEFLLGDKLRLNQILLNLLSNAVKYTPDGGKIDFRISELSGGSQQFTTLRFTVSDNGIGMSEEFQTKVFAPFSREINSVTNKIQGTGLGMAITKNLVDLMGGIIDVRSEPGKGSTFTVELTFSLPEKEESDSWLRKNISKMLVADDEEDVRNNIAELMKDTGIGISCAEDGQEAVDMAVRENESGQGFDVILLDWKMPGTDGVMAAKMIREKLGANVPILVLTSHDWADIEEEAREAGINAFMSKPFFLSSFKQAVKPLLSDAEAVRPPEPEQCDSVMKDKLFLVAEDNELNAEILREMLGIEGAKCDITVNGKEAYEKFLSSEPGHYDMILMDVQMPVMNGYEATAAIRSCQRPDAKTIPIAAMTANTFAEDVKNSLEAGMDGHLAKPIDMNAVKELVSKLLGKNDNSEGDNR